MAESKNIFERGLWRNPMSYLGMLLSIGSALTILVLLVIDFLATFSSPYFGVLLFFILPVSFMAGFLLIVWGMWDEHKRRRRGHTDEIPQFPVLDLNDPGNRVRFFVFMAGTVSAVILLTVIAYQAYHFTESRVFCGDLCHQVMAPEATTAKNSPHARVLCTECHVGPGAGWYVRSKLAGARQLFAVLLKTYPKPIPPAIEHLRPARETCEECHWPEKFFGSTMRVRTHFGFDEKNTPHDVSMLVKIGGGDNSSEEGGSGIHWHMLSEEKVTFRAADPGQQVIPIVWDKQADGTVVEYKLQDYEEKENSGGGRDKDIRLVDCVVCHNRPTHIYNSPQRSMDKALLEEAIDHTLPYIKREGVRVLIGDYKTKKQAFEEIDSKLRSFYDRKYPGVAASRADDINQAIKAIQHIYDQNFFPSMNVSWKVYPNNIGHRDSPGCFRCHDGKHVSKDGKVIRRKCTICHTMPKSGPSKQWTAGYPAGAKWETWHPWALKGKHALMNCSVCHTGGMIPPRDCATCHEEKNVTHYSKNGGMSDLECSDCHQDLQKVRPLVECTDCHDDLGGLHVKVEEHKDADCTTCHQAHLWVVNSRDTCYQCHDDRTDHNPDEFCGDCHKFN